MPANTNSTLKQICSKFQRCRPRSARIFPHPVPLSLCHASVPNFTRVLPADFFKKIDT